jgi:hypothetical protein
VTGDADIAARITTDRLAIALEEVGFDVGREFPALAHEVSHEGAPIVNLGRVTAPVADRLRRLLLRPEGSRCFGGEHWT